MEDDARRNRKLYFKNLRKQQKKRRKERKKQEKVVTQNELQRERLRSLVDKIRNKIQAGENNAHEDELLLSQSKEIDLGACSSSIPNCTATTFAEAEKLAEAQSQKRKETEQSKEPQLKRSRLLEETRGTVKEIDSKNIVLSVKTIGAGSFGTCRLAKFRSMDVVVKEFKGFAESTAEKQKQDVLREAKVIASLGDHKGLPLLFGVQTSQIPFSLVLQFHGDGERSLNIYRAACKKKLTAGEWKSVINQVIEALRHIHDKGFLHNDLKANNVVLEKTEDGYNAVVIDFGKSRKIDAPKKRKNLSKAKQKVYQQSYPHIAPEIVSGTGDQTTASDVYSLAQMVNFICDKTGLVLSAEFVILKNLALSSEPEARPKLVDFVCK